MPLALHAAPRLLHASASIAELCDAATLPRRSNEGGALVFPKVPPSACAVALLACCWTSWAAPPRLVPRADQPTHGVIGE